MTSWAKRKINKKKTPSKFISTKVHQQNTLQLYFQCFFKIHSFFFFIVPRSSAFPIIHQKHYLTKYKKRRTHKTTTTTCWIMENSLYLFLYRITDYILYFFLWEFWLLLLIKVILLWWWLIICLKDFSNSVCLLIYEVIVVFGSFFWGKPWESVYYYVYECLFIYWL